MLKVISFDLEGDFAAFRDPSVTTNQTVYLIPSKTQVIGLLGAILGIERGHQMKNLYSKGILDLLSATKIGIRVRTESQKMSFFTNHRSLKESKTKPIKAEVLINPKYTIYVQTSDDYYAKLKKILENNEFKYTPFLGHAYCPARIRNFCDYNASEKKSKCIETNSVVLDEINESVERDSSLKGLEFENGNVSTTVERHLHNFVQSGELKKIVLRHWIPLNGGKIAFDYQSRLQLTSFLELQSPPSETVCFY